MSEEAIIWVSEWAPVPSHLVGTVLGIAIYADKDGCGSFPSQETIAWHARKSTRQVRNDLLSLEHDLKLIARGDQSLAAHIPADERPVVWNLAMDLRRDPRPERDRKPTSARYSEGTEAHFRPNGSGTGSPLPSEGEEGTEVDFRANDTTGSPLPPETEGTEAHFRANERGSGSGLPTKKKKRMTSSSSLPAVTRIADALSIDEDDAQEIYNRIAGDPNINAPSRYIDSLIGSGDITKFRPAVKPVSAPPANAHDFVEDHTGWCGRCGLPRTHAKHGSRT